MIEKHTEDTSLKKMFQSLIPDKDGVLQGIVLSSSPLEIQIANDEKLVLGMSALIIPWHLTNYKTVMDMSLKKGGKDQIVITEVNNIHYIQSIDLHSIEITIYNELKTGEKVHILALNSGKKYYVLDRVV